MTRIQTVPAQPPAPQAPPAPTTAPGPAIAGQPAVNVPAQGFTQAYVRALEAKGAQLSRQLSSAQGRRDQVARDYRNSSEPAVREGLQQRLAVLDGRLAQLETDIAANGRQLAAAPGNLLTSASTGSGGRDGGPPFSEGQLTAISIVFTLFVMAPLAFAAARRMLRRPFETRPTPQILESAARLERMEQAVDAIAVEIERISEGQRFVTSLMAKRESPALQQAYAGGNQQGNATGNAPSNANGDPAGAEPLRAAEPLQASGQGAR
jgi:hypothetical protein